VPTVKKDSGWYDDVLRQRREREARKSSGKSPLRTKTPVTPTAREGWMRWIVAAVLFVVGAVGVFMLLQFVFAA
jgi:hypothetical protein